MLPLETGKAGLKKIDFDILKSLENPKTVDQLRKEFPGVNVARKLLDLQKKEFIHENNFKYVTRFYTPEIKSLIARSKLSTELKDKFNFFLSQMDNPFVREIMYDDVSRRKTEYILSSITRSLTRSLNNKEIVMLKIYMRDLMRKLG